MICISILILLQIIIAVIIFITITDKPNFNCIFNSVVFITAFIMMLWQYCNILRYYELYKIYHKNVFMRLDLLKRENYIDIIT